jgi:NADH-quinone oxidoreductase subunit I
MPIEVSNVAYGFKGIHFLSVYCWGYEKCIICRLCEVICPAHAITLDSGNEMRCCAVYEINYVRCIFCRLCVEICPIDAIAESIGIEVYLFNIHEWIQNKSVLLMNGMNSW